MLKVGLTGNIASGKSSVARAWQARGAEVIDADVLARRAVQPGSEGLRRIATEWGREVLTPDGALDRAALREIVFQDEDARERLEAIVHPEVQRLRDEAYADAEEGGEALVVADIPLLFEVGLEDEFDVLVLVDAPEDVRKQRMVRDRGMDPAEAQRMIDAQMPASEKRARADIVIENTGSKRDLELRADEVWEQLMRLAAKDPPAAESRDG